MHVTCLQTNRKIYRKRVQTLPTPQSGLPRDYLCVCVLGGQGKDIKDMGKFLNI